MRLTELHPQWLSPDVFIFRNPTGGTHWLTCKRVPMRIRDQRRLVYGDYMDSATKTEWFERIVVMTNPDSAWRFEGNDFETLTVTPSINASASGDWHGFITAGEIRP